LALVRDVEYQSLSVGAAYTFGRNPYGRTRLCHAEAGVISLLPARVSRMRPDDCCEMCEPFRLCEELGNAYSHVMAQDR
jgi:hypothetical protein